MAVLYRNDAFSMHFQQKTVLKFFEKGVPFPENLFQSQSIENVQNFH